MIKYGCNTHMGGTEQQYVQEAFYNCTHWVSFYR